MVATKTPTKKMFRRYMIEADIDSFLELAKISGMEYQTLNVRLKSPETFRIYEIQILNKLLHFTEEDLLQLIKGEV